MMGRMMVGKYRSTTPTRRRADRGRGVQASRATSARRRLRASLGRSGWPTRWSASGSGSRPASGCRASARGSCAVAKWGDIGFANVAFGQGLTVTPLQMAGGRLRRSRAGGIYRQPRIVARVVQPDGTIEAPPPARARSGA